MIETAGDTLIMSAPELDPAARLVLSFAELDHSPADDAPATALLPVQRVDDHADGVPPDWLAAGGVLIPRPPTPQVRMIVGPAGGATGWRRPWALTLGVDGVDLLTGRPWAPQLRPQISVPIPRRRPHDGSPAGREPSPLVTPAPVVGIPRAARIVPNYVRLSRGRTLDLPVPDDALQLMACPAAAESSPRGGRVFHGRRPDEMPTPRRLSLPWALDHACCCLVRIVPAEVWASITGARTARHGDRRRVRELPLNTGSERHDLGPVRPDRMAGWRLR